MRLLSMDPLGKVDAERMPVRGPFTARPKRGIPVWALVDDWRDLRPRGGRRRGLEREGPGLERLAAGDLRDGGALRRARRHGDGRAGDEDGLAQLYAGRHRLRPRAVPRRAHATPPPDRWNR